MDDEICKKLENAGSSLWNCAAIAVKTQKDCEKEKILCYCKLFASMLLSISEACCPCKDKKLSIFKCYIIIFKLIVDRDLVQLITKLQDILDRSLGTLESLESSFESSEVDTFQKLKLEFLLLKFQCSVKDGDLETARIYSSKADITGNVALLDASTLLELCRIIYNAAIALNGSLDARSTEYAISLLKDVQIYLELPIADLVCRSEFNNIKYMSLLFLTNCLIESDTASLDVSESQKYINLLQSTYPKKAEPFILGIKLAKKNGKTDNQSAITEIIIRMIMSVEIITAFDAVISAISDFATIDTKKAIKYLDYVFLNKLNPKEDQQLLDKIMVTRFFITTQAKTMTECEKLDSLDDFSCVLERRIAQNPSEHALSSIIALLWNSGKMQEKGGNFHQSIGYYKLALNNVLSEKYEDKAKIQRALQNVYIKIDKFCEAEAIHQKMTARDRESPLSQLLMLKAHLNSQDEAKASECLEKIKNSEHENAIDVFILAAAECRRCSNLTIRGTLMLFEMLEDSRIAEKTWCDFSFSIACILRSTVQMIIKMTEDSPQEVLGKHLDILNILLKNGVSLFKRFDLLRTIEKKTKKGASNIEVISFDEVEWFASTSYNIALQCKKRHNEHRPEFAAYSLQYIQMIPTEKMDCTKLVHYLYWRYRASLLHIDSESKVIPPQDELELHRLQKDCTCLIDDIIEKLKDDRLSKECTPEQLAQINECLVDSLVLSFEIALTARDQRRIRNILKKTTTFSSSHIDELLFETAASSADLPGGILSEILRTIINRNIANTATSNHLICSWLTNLLDTCPDTTENSDKDLIDRFLARIKATIEPTDPKLPVFKQELETLATLNWNQGVRCIINGDKHSGASWCTNSIAFANLANQALETNLKTMWIALSSSANIENT
ncbi:hypothetical protein HG537_0D06110 [Torulaspora globosa]|uniref:Protein ZIP4 homolog n=1 Tax=Torulaspora globosa TaxID=48254 RepID=A0A7H9HTC8_9SACH|nr:hypothetical protein HG537_0D06110 [Torulaspora sp. CBS 2947]